MQYIIFGDVHGCLRQVEEMLCLIGPAADDRIISVGDFVGRGPNSPGCTDFFMRHESVMGNHEYKHVRHRNGVLKTLAPSQIGTIRQYALAGKDYAAAVSFMASLPFFLDLPDAIVVHAGLQCGIPLEQQDRIVLVGGMSKRRITGIDSATGWPYWCASWPRDAKPVVFGHLSVRRDGLFRPQNLFALDTGCCSGGMLSAIALPSFRFYQVNGWRKEKAFS